jgi:hypothetical protein
LFNNNPGRKMVLWGDSHCVHLANGIRANYSDVDWAVISMASGGVTPVINYVKSKNLDRKEQVIGFNALAFDLILNDDSIQAVCLGSFWSSNDGDLDSMEQNYILQVDRILEKKKAVYFLMDSPTFEGVPSPLKIVRNRFAFGSFFERVEEKSIGLDEYEEMNYVQNRLIRISQSKGIKVLDPRPFLVDNKNPNKFFMWLDGQPLYYDSNHYSRIGSTRAATMFSSIFGS